MIEGYGDDLRIDGILVSELVSRNGGCPYNCHQGKIYMPALKSWSPCPICSEKNKEIARGIELNKEGMDIYKILSIPETHRYKEFDTKDFFGDYVVERTTEDSRLRILDTFTKIRNFCIRGDKLDSNYLFYLGMETDELVYIFDVLREAYSSGLKVVPYLNTTELLCLKQSYKNIGYEFGENLEKEFKCNYSDVVRSDFLVLCLSATADERDFALVSDLLEERTRRGKRTVIISKVRGSARDYGYFLNHYSDMQVFGLESKSMSYRSNTTKESTQHKPVSTTQIYQNGVPKNIGVVSESKNETKQKSVDREEEYQRNFLNFIS